MIKPALLATIVVLSHCYTFQQFQNKREECRASFMGSCEFLPLNRGETLSEDEMECAKEYQKSTVCFYYYPECLPRSDDDPTS